ncbi:MAG: EamA/RhaT family transporter, partial [Pseudomonadota bacterium]
MQQTQDHTHRAIWVLLASVTAMAFADALIKLVSDDLSLWQIFMLRSLCGLPVLLWLTPAAELKRALRSPSVWLRSALLVLCWLAYYTSLPLLDLSL